MLSRAYTSVISRLRQILAPANRIAEFTPEMKRVLENSGWLILERVVRIAVNVIIGVLFARYLGPGQLGIYSYALAIITILTAISSLGLENIVIKNVIADREEAEKVLGTAFALRVVSGICIVLATVIISVNFEQPEPLRTMLLILTASLILQSFDVIDYWFQANNSAKTSAIARAVSFSISNIIKLGLILIKAPLTLFAAAFTLEVFLYATALLIAYRQNRQHITRWRINALKIKSILMECYPLLISTIVVVLTMQIDKILISFFAGANELGVYAAATRLSEILYFIPVFIGQALTPLLMKRRQENIDGYRKLLQTSYSAMSFTSLLIALLVSTLAPYIIHAIYGSKFAPSAAILSIHVWSGVFIFHVSIRTRAFVIENLQSYVALYALLALILNIALNVLLIPSQGANGAAIASVISWMACALLLPLISNKTRQTPVMLLKSLIPSTLRRL